MRNEKSEGLGFELNLVEGAVEVDAAHGDSNVGFGFGGGFF